uniref:Uncharacterized protein n=1 Tax=Klebsiella pneumoniae TaxID=573 RepID=A0A8B0SU09_KLEPN|nr:hypothetical protein [Klebsiella pneumoniae]
MRCSLNMLLISGQMHRMMHDRISMTNTRKKWSTTWSGPSLPHCAGGVKRTGYSFFKVHVQ